MEFLILLHCHLNNDESIHQQNCMSMSHNNVNSRLKDIPRRYVQTTTLSKICPFIEFACLFSVIIQIRNVCPMTGFEYIPLMAVKQIPVHIFRVYLVVY